jgi:hypothetical protein
VDLSYPESLIYYLLDSECVIDSLNRDDMQTESSLVHLARGKFCA